LIVIDVSAEVAVLLSAAPEAESIRERVAGPGETLHVPHLFEIEVLHALRSLTFRGTVSPERAHLALRRLLNTRLVRYPHTTLVERIWALRENLTAYDAAYVALAEALDAPLVTTDGRLARAPGIRAAVEVYG
jgi:predicted nucleic acid-binding protein